MIGLSGLITPSLEEMSHIAREMKRLGYDIPLLIGGATTSKAHTAIKIDPHYDQPTVWVKDASRAVGVAQKLISRDMKQTFIDELRDEYEQVRLNYSKRQAQTEWLTLDQARANKPKFDWTSYAPVKPELIGLRVFEDYPLEELRDYIDWTPFFHTWEMKKRYPNILDDPEKGEEARKLFNDAQDMLDKIIAEKWLRAQAVVGLFPANSIDDDDIEVYSDESRSEPVAVLRNLRQQLPKADGKPNYNVSDFVAPKSSGVKDYMGAFAVTTGIGIEKKVAEFEQQHDDYNSIMLKALADRLAEAFAERMHQRVRREFWGYAPDENLANDELIKESYRGIRPAPGYPANPEHTEKTLLWQLLNVEKNAGIELTDSMAMMPAASVSGWYFAHPESRYFAVGKINRDQVEDYARRKGMSIAEAERWLAPNLGYST